MWCLVWCVFVWQYVSSASTPTSSMPTRYEIWMKSSPELASEEIFWAKIKICSTNEFWMLFIGIRVGFTEVCTLISIVFTIDQLINRTSHIMSIIEIYISNNCVVHRVVWSQSSVVNRTENQSFGLRQSINEYIHSLLCHNFVSIVRLDSLI